MKTRNGFVSNSSSSSFVILGIKTTDKEVIERAEKLDLYSVWVEGEDYCVIGTKISSWSEGEGAMGSINFSELQTKAASLAQRLAELDLPHPEELQLIYGEMMT